MQEEKFVVFSYLNKDGVSIFVGLERESVFAQTKGRWKISTEEGYTFADADVHEIKSVIILMQGLSLEEAKLVVRSMRVLSRSAMGESIRNKQVKFGYEKRVEVQEAQEEADPDTSDEDHSEGVSEEEASEEDDAISKVDPDVIKLTKITNLNEAMLKQAKAYLLSRKFTFEGDNDKRVWYKYLGQLLDGKIGALSGDPDKAIPAETWLSKTKDQTLTQLERLEATAAKNSIDVQLPGIDRIVLEAVLESEAEEEDGTASKEEIDSALDGVIEAKEDAHEEDNKKVYEEYVDSVSKPKLRLPSGKGTKDDYYMERPGVTPEDERDEILGLTNLYDSAGNDVTPQKKGWQVDVYKKSYGDESILPVTKEIFEAAQEKAARKRVAAAAHVSDNEIAQMMVRTYSDGTTVKKGEFDERQKHIEYLMLLHTKNLLLAAKCQREERYEDKETYEEKAINLERTLRKKGIHQDKLVSRSDIGRLRSSELVKIIDETKAEIRKLKQQKFDYEASKPITEQERLEITLTQETMLLRHMKAEGISTVAERNHQRSKIRAIKAKLEQLKEGLEN